MTPIPLGDDRLLVLYNRRYGKQAIMMCLVTFTQEAWTVRHASMMYDAKAHRERAADLESGIDELDSFAFGFPTLAVPTNRPLLPSNCSLQRAAIVPIIRVCRSVPLPRPS